MSENFIIELDPETTRKLDALAERSHKTKYALAAEAIEAFVANADWQEQEIQQGIEDLDAARTLSHESVKQWLASWGTEGEQKAPR